ncbi:MAG TPA: LapA family protein [Pseudonocardia sp.]|uniref:LapA family protein n=1 Tax=Pseudonocardia sp. TaxID=60912 RepID=UPI002CF57DE2|nr:LapA family protein [Pseudonocardia sp.]HTF51198.1 LapA family protein [Pseudonocardia sp.]
MASPEGSPVRPRHRVSPRLIAALVVVALAVLFIAQNRDTVQIHLFAATLTSPLWLLLVVMAGLGALIGFLLARRR